MILVTDITMVLSVEREVVEGYVAIIIVIRAFLLLVEEMVDLIVIAIVNIICVLMVISKIALKVKLVKFRP